MVQLINGFEWGREKKTSAYIRINVSTDFSNEFCLRYFEQRWIYMQNNTSRMSDANDFISFSTRFSFVMRFVFIHSCNITTKRHGKIKIKIPIESRWQYYVAYDQCYRPVHALFYIHFVSVSSHFKFLNFNWPPFEFFHRSHRHRCCLRPRDRKPKLPCIVCFLRLIHSFSFGYWIRILSPTGRHSFCMLKLNKTR